LNGPVRVPRALVLATIGPVVAVLIAGLVGLVLAMLGWYRAELVLLVSLPLSAIAVVSLARRLPRAPFGRELAAATAIVGALLCVVALWNAKHHGEHVLVDRDPASYNATARLVADTGGLTFPARPGGFAAATSEQLGGAAWFYDESQDRMEAQFNHLFPGLLALGHDLGGLRLMFVLPSLFVALGLATVFVVALALGVAPWLAAAGTLALALAPPQVAIARDSYSEAVMQPLLWSALLLALVVSRSRPDRVLLLVVGALVGGLLAARIDGLLYAAPMVILLAAHLLGGPSDRERWRDVTAVVVPAVVIAAVGTVDAAWFAGEYVPIHRTELALLRLSVLALVAGAAAVVVVSWRRPSWWARITESVRAASTVAGVVLVVLLALAWLVRPLVTEVQGSEPNALVAVLQEAEGSEVDPTRTYAEYSLWWQSWYLGPVVLAAAIAGAGMILRRALLGDRALAIFAVVGATGLLYLYRPSIVPDQLWATRRFIVVVTPWLLVAAAWLATRGVERAGRAAAPVTVAITGLAVAIPLVTLWPLRSMAEQRGSAAPAEGMCDRIAGAPVVILADPYLGDALPAVLAGWCGSPSVSLPAGADPEQLLEIVENWASEGETVWVLSGESSVVDGATGGRSEVVMAFVSALGAEARLSGPPSRLRQAAVRVHGAPVS
jgi:hypothetical protein